MLSGEALLSGPMAKEQWSSRLGVILAVAGSAVGLGNFLRFPGQAAQYGGGAFMVAYFLSLLFIGIPMCWAEWSMGRYGGQRGFNSSPGIFHICLGHPLAKYVGVIGVVIPVVIYMYYVSIEAWCLGYAVNFLFGSLDVDSAVGAKKFFSDFIGISENGAALSFGFGKVGYYLFFAFILNFVLIYRGLSKGIEWFCTWAMPALIILALVVLVRVLTLGAPVPAQPENNVLNGLGFMWNPEKVVLEVKNGGAWKIEREVIGKTAIMEAQALASNSMNQRVRVITIWEQLKKPQLWLAAAGQIFFSLSVGFGVILTYASYLRNHDDIVLSGLSATSANEFCEVALGGLITLPAGVAFLGVAGVAGMSTFGLGFNVLPMVFSLMPYGQIFGALFFFLLFLAAITSSLSMLQPGIAFLEEALHIGRRQSVGILGFITLMGCGFVLYFSKDLKALDTLDFWVGTFLIFTLASVQIVIFSWGMGAERMIAEASRGATFSIPKIFIPIFKYICPAFLLIVFSLWFVHDVFGFNFSGGKVEPSSYVQDLFVTPNPVAWLSILIVLSFAIFIALLVRRASVYHGSASRHETL